MTDIARIDEEVVNTDEFVRILKLAGRFDSLIEDIIKDKLAVHAAKKQGISVGTEELQERADELRRAKGLHRAKEMNAFLDSTNITLDQFEQFVSEALYKEKLMEALCSDAAVEEFYNLNSPRFEAVDLSHIIVDSEGKAREIMYMLEDEPGTFAELAREHSQSDTKDTGGVIGKVSRGALKPEVEAKVFNANPGELLGPFPSDDGDVHELFMVSARSVPSLDAETRSEIKRLLYEGWLGSRAGEHRLEAL